MECPPVLPWQAHAAPARAALFVREFLATKQITVLEHPAYSPDLAPNDFFLLPKIKDILKGRHFDDIRPFHKTSSKIVLKGGLGAGIGA